MKFWTTCGFLVGAGVLFSAGARTVHPAQPPGNQDAFRVVNITSDSAPGWLPSTAQEQLMLAKVHQYLSDVDAGNYHQAYTVMAAGLRNSLTAQDYITSKKAFRGQAGSLISRKILKVTWTKDPQQAPFPGIYAAVDISARYQRVDRYCGYLVLYQNPSGGDFEVMREEQNFIDNTTAEKLQEQQSRAALDRLWAALSMNCPNYEPHALQEQQGANSAG